MTAFCDWVAAIAFLVALILCLIAPGWNGQAAPAPAPGLARWNWATFVVIGLLAWAIPIALTASHVTHS